MNCWICGSVADSREHKIKKSLLVELHGAGPYLGPRKLSHGMNGRIVDIQGPDSNRLKYSAVICADCNNRRTQKYDIAYQVFTRFCIQNAEALLRDCTLNLEDVFGSHAAQSSARELYRYFVKHLGCDLANAGLFVPLDLVQMFTVPEAVCNLRISFALDSFPLGIPYQVGPIVGNGALITTQKNLKTKDDFHYIWSSYFSCMRICYWYDCIPDLTLGQPWRADAFRITLGLVSSRNLPDDATHIKKA